MNKRFITSVLIFILTFTAILSSCKVVHEHELTYSPGAKETCENVGKIGCYICSICGKKFSDAAGENEIVGNADEIKATGHTLVEVKREEPTCVTDGHIAYYSCSVCQKMFSDAEGKERLAAGDEIISSTGKEHLYAYTSLSNGKHTATCLNCGEKHDEDCVQNTLDENLKTHFYKSECVCGGKSLFEELPRIYITTDTGEAITGGRFNKPKFSCKITIECDEQPQFNLKEIAGEVKVRGNFTADYVKKPYQIKFGKKQVMLGMDGGKKSKKWVLIADFKDPSKMRNSTAFFLGDAILGSDGYYVSDYRHVEVFENGVSKGLYLLCDQQETGSARVNISEPEDGYTGTDIGYLVEMDGYAENEAPLEQFKADYGETDMKFLDGTDAVDHDVNVITPGRYFERRYSIKSDIYSEEQNKYIQKTISNIFKITYDAVYGDHGDIIANPYKTLDENNDIAADYSIKTAKEAVEKVIDLQSLVDTYILNEICLDMDVGWSSFRMAFDAGKNGKKKLVFEAPWDWDSAFGYAVQRTDILLCANAYSGLGTATSTKNIWLLVLVGQDWFWQEIYEKWVGVKNSGAFDEAINRLDLHTAAYKTIRDKDNSLWVNAGGDSRGTNDAAVAWLKNWLKKRIDWLDGKFYSLSK